MFPAAVLGIVKPLYSYFRRAATDTTQETPPLTIAKMSLADAEIETKHLFPGGEGEKGYCFPLQKNLHSLKCMKN